MPKSTRARSSAKRKAVLRLRRGESLDLLSRELGVKGATLSGWREAFLEGGLGSLRSRARDGRDGRILELRASEADGRVVAGWRPSGPSAVPAVSETCSPSTARPTSCGARSAVEQATQTLPHEGTATIFVAVDHCTAACVGSHAARRGTHFEALEPIRQAVRQGFDHTDRDVAASLSIRHDHGSQSMGHDVQAELKFLGIRSTPAFGAEPERNGVAERFIRTLKEPLLWVETFASVEALNEALHRFGQRYDDGWLVQKHGHRTPSQVRARLSPPAAQAA